MQFGRPGRSSGPIAPRPGARRRRDRRVAAAAAERSRQRRREEMPARAGQDLGPRHIDPRRGQRLLPGRRGSRPAGPGSAGRRSRRNSPPAGPRRIAGHERLAGRTSPAAARRGRSRSRAGGAAAACGSTLRSRHRPSPNPSPPWPAVPGGSRLSCRVLQVDPVVLDRRRGSAVAAGRLSSLRPARLLDRRPRPGSRSRAGCSPTCRDTGRCVSIQAISRSRSRRREVGDAAAVAARRAAWPAGRRPSRGCAAGRSAPTRSAVPFMQSMPAIQ